MLTVGILVGVNRLSSQRLKFGKLAGDMKTVALKSAFVAPSLVVLTTLLSACGQAPHADNAPPAASSSESFQEGRDEVENIVINTWAGAAAVREIPDMGETRHPHLKSLSRFLLVETSSAIVTSNYLKAMRTDPPGGIVFWNSSKAGSQELASAIKRYSEELERANQSPILFSLDYEGGGLSMAPSGKNIPGIQRFRQGFTDTAHGSWLGRSLALYGTELCGLHGRIMGAELSAVGINYPLTLVADLQQNLFKTRGVSRDAREVAECLAVFTHEMAKAGPVIAVTKHYPGLGQNVGDTHDVESVSIAKTRADSDRHLLPFRQLIAFANREGLESRLSIMSSHGKFPHYDPHHLTTESEVLLTKMMRDEFGFKGIRVSDAMWMGGYGSLDGAQLYAVYLNAFRSGLDLLMIPGNRFGGALRAFRAVYLNEAPADLIAALETRSGLSYEEFRAQFLSRVEESLGRIQATMQTLPYAHKSIREFQMRMGEAAQPRDATPRERARYNQILKSLAPNLFSDLSTEPR